MSVHSLAPNVDIRISPAIDPETYRAVDGYNDETRGYVDDVVSAFNDAYLTLGKLHDARELWERNPATTEAQRILIVSKEAAKHKERVTKRLDRAHDALKARIGFTEGELSRPLVEQAGLGTLNGEIRAHAKSLSRGDREKLVKTALAGDDAGTLTAILGAPAFLSGMTDIDHGHFLHEFHAKKNPHLVTRLAVMRRVLELVYRNGAVLHSQFDRAVGAKPHDATAIARANERALNALKIEPTP